MGEQLKIIFRQESLNAELVLQIIEAVFVRKSMPLTDFILYDERIDLPLALQRLRESGKKTFNLVGRQLEFIAGSVGNYHLDFLQIRSKNSPAISWDEWVNEFIDNPNFVMAWVADREYDHWQNANDPLEYTTMGRPYKHLPMKSNDLPYPLEKMIVDTSSNPGRWSFREGYIEAIGATMWLGEPFWPLTGVGEETIRNTPWLNASRPSSNAIKLQVADRPFKDAEADSREVQTKLRSLLFPMGLEKSEAVGNG